MVFHPKITKEERAKIAVMLRRGTKVKTISRRVGRPERTIERVIARIREQQLSEEACCDADWWCSDLERRLYGADGRARCVYHAGLAEARKNGRNP